MGGCLGEHTANLVVCNGADLSVVFEPCDRPGGIHLTLLPFAVVSLLVYVLGYPSLLASILYRNRMIVMEDQLLRAQGKGHTRLENPHAYDFRKRYHRLCTL